MIGTRRLLCTGLFGLFVLVAGFGSWAAFTEISGAVIASGRLAAMQDDQVVQHPEGGVVADILAREGALVAAGDILVRLDDQILSAELEATRYRLAALEMRIARFEAEQAGADAVNFPPLSDLVGAAASRDLRAGQQDIFASRLAARAAAAARLTQQETQTAARISGLEKQRTALADQLALVQDEIDDQESLASRGLATEARLNALRREHAQLAGQKGSTEAGIAEAEAAYLQMRTDHEQTLISLREETATDLEAARLERATLNERLATLGARAHRLDIRAPIGGRVHDLRLHAIGGVLRGADAVARIVSDATSARIIGRVAPVHVDDLHPGQEARLRFPALNARTTPETSGRLLRISADTLEDQVDGESYYEVEIEITEEGVAALGHEALVPGMPVEAYIHTEPRSPLSYLLRPLGDYFARAFRET